MTPKDLETRVLDIKRDTIVTARRLRQLHHDIRVGPDSLQYLRAVDAAFAATNAAAACLRIIASLIERESK